MMHLKPFAALALALSLSACTAISAASNTASSAVDTVALNDYTNSNMVAIRTDAARGHGEHVDALAGLYGLETAEADRFKAMLKMRYDVVFGHENPNAMLNQVAAAARS